MAAIESKIMKDKKGDCNDDKTERVKTTTKKFVISLTVIFVIKNSRGN